jgi:RHS repeat-associated protein
LAAEVRHDSSFRVYVYEDNVALVPFMFVEYTGLDAEPASGKRYYIFTNQIGVPIRVEDDAGRSCWSARIDPYGCAQIARDSRLEMPLRFPGHYHDPETGLHYNRFRYFSPELGRYLQSDPAGLEGGINLYAYPTDPLTDADIDGLMGRRRRARARASGTNGEETPQEAGASCPIRPINPRTGKEDLALIAARREAARVRREAAPVPMCTAAVRDKKTGKIYVASSGPPALKPSEAHPDLGMPNKSKEPWPVGNCAEPKAMNAALNAGAKKEDLQVASVNTVDGSPKQCCRNCTETTRGTTVSPATSN